MEAARVRAGAPRRRGTFRQALEDLFGPVEDARLEVVLAEFEQRRADLEQAQTEALTKAQERAAKLDGLMVQITQKAGVDGKLFGSVTNVDISDALKKHDLEVPRAAIRMPQGPLKQVGDHPIKIALHADVVVTVTVSVLGEQ